MDTLTKTLGVFGQAVIDVYKALEFEFFGMHFNFLSLIIWSAIAYFVIDIIHDLTDI